MSVFLGVATYRRWDYLARVLAMAAVNLAGVVDRTVVVHDGPPGFDWQPGRTVDVAWLDRRSGVAAVKNALLRRALESEADWIILAEDDILALSARAVTGYVAAAEASGIEHLCFHAHGPANPPGSARGTDDTGTVTYWPNFVGAWCVTSRESVRRVGYLDEAMYNALEHVEWTMRMAACGFCPLFERGEGPLVADATGSESWLAEIPGSIEHSAIRADGDAAQRERFRAARDYWRAKNPVLAGRVFG